MTHQKQQKKRTDSVICCRQYIIQVCLYLNEIGDIIPESVKLKAEQKSETRMTTRFRGVSVIQIFLHLTGEDISTKSKDDNLSDSADSQVLSAPRVFHGFR